MISLENIKELNTQTKLGLTSRWLGKAAYLGDAASEIPATYRRTNSMTAALTVAAIAIRASRLEDDKLNESRSLSGGQEQSPFSVASVSLNTGLLYYSGEPSRPALQ